MSKVERKSYVIHLDLISNPTVKTKPGSESSLEARSEDGDLVSPNADHDPRIHEDDVNEEELDREAKAEDLANQQLTDGQDPRSQSPQRYIVETITMTTVTERRIVREADDASKKKEADAAAAAGKLSGILKGGKLWKSGDPVNPADHEEVTAFSSPGSPEEVDAKRFVRFNHDGDDGDAISPSQDDGGADERLAEPAVDNMETPSPDTTELTLTFKLGNHVLVANSLKPNSAVRQLFPAQRLVSPNQRYLQEPGDQDENDVMKTTPQQYLVTAESLKLFEESKRAKVSNFYNNQDTLLANAMNTEDVPVNANLIKRTIERNTLRRSLLRYEPGRNKRCMKRHDDNSLVERIKQLTCDVDDDVPPQDYGEVLERSSPTGEESKPPKPITDNNSLKPNPVASNEVGSNGIRYIDKSLSPSSSSSSGSNTSTYKKLTDLFGRRNDKVPHDHVDHACVQQEYVVNADYNNAVYLSPPDLGNGLPLTPPKDFGVDRSGVQQTFVQPKQAVTKTATSEARKQFLSTLAPLTACVGAGNGSAAPEDGDYYHVSPGMHPLAVRVGDRLSVASTNTESEYSLNDIDEVLEDESSQPQPDVVAGTQTDTRTQAVAKGSSSKGVLSIASKGSGAQGGVSKSEAQAGNSKAPPGKGSTAKAAPKGAAVSGGSLKASSGKQKSTNAQAAGSKAPPGGQNPDATDELALFVQQDASRTERIKKRYSLNSSPTNTSDDENDDYGFNKRPSVRGIKPRFGSTTEILQQMQSQMQPPTLPCNSRVTWPYPNEPHPRKGIPVRSPQMPCVQEENVIYYQGNYNGNHICANQNFAGHQVCMQNHANIGCGHQAVGCGGQNQVPGEAPGKDGMGRKYVSNSTIYASTGNLYENQNQIMRIGGGCSEGHMYGTLGVRYLHHQTHLQHPGSSSSPPPPGIHRDFQNYNVANVVTHTHDGLPPCMNQDPRFSAEMHNCHYHKERRYSGDVLPITQKELRYPGENMPNPNPQNQKDLRYSGEGLPTTAIKDPRFLNETVPNCHHPERYAEPPVGNQKDPRYFYGDMNSNQRYAGVGEGVPAQFQDAPPCNVHYQDSRPQSGVQTLDRNFSARRCAPNAVQMRISPTSSTQAQQYQTTVSQTSVRMSAPFSDPNITAIIDPHYSTYRPPNPPPPIRVGVGQQQTIRVPYSGTPVQVHLMARGVRSESPQRCGSPLGTPPGMTYPQCVVARGTQTQTVQHQAYQGGRGYYGRVAGEHSSSGGNPALVANMLFEVGYQDMPVGIQKSISIPYPEPPRSQPSEGGPCDPQSCQGHETALAEPGPQPDGDGASDKSPNYDVASSQQAPAYENQMQVRQRQLNPPPVYQTQNGSPTKQNTERGVPEGAASVPTSFPQDSTYTTNSTNTATSPMESTGQMEQVTLTSSPGVYYSMNV